MFPQKLRSRPAGNTTMGIGTYGIHFPILREVFQSICSTPLAGHVFNVSFVGAKKDANIRFVKLIGSNNSETLLYAARDTKSIRHAFCCEV
jgi:hypothetical protein